MDRTQYRFWGMQKPRPRTPILDSVPSPSTSLDTATMRIYEPIDSWGDIWGVSAKEFTEALDALPSSVQNIDLRLNSPGGDVFEGIAIMNALREHPANVTVTVEGLAASAASFLAVGAGKTVMAPNSQMMIHDAWGVVMGNAADMTKMASTLDKISENIASVYAAKAGGSVASWRSAMQTESWYDAQEAVSLGLADGMADEPADAQNRFDLSIFSHAGRTNAPEPILPSSNVKFAEHAESVFTDCESLYKRFEEVIAFRTEQGKSRLSEDSVELLDRFDALAKRFAALRIEPADTRDEAAREYVRFVALTQGV